MRLSETLWVASASNSTQKRLNKRGFLLNRCIQILRDVARDLPLHHSSQLYFFFFSLERESGCTHAKGAKGQRQRENFKQTPLWGRSQRCPAPRPHHPEIMTWDQVTSLTPSWLSHPGAPIISYIHQHKVSNKNPYAFNTYKNLKPEEIYKINTRPKKLIQFKLTYWIGCCFAELTLRLTMSICSVLTAVSVTACDWMTPFSYQWSLSNYCETFANRSSFDSHLTFTWHWYPWRLYENVLILYFHFHY